MTSVTRLSASTPFLQGVPNSMVSPEWYRLLVSVVQVLGGGKNIIDLDSFENFVLSELPAPPDEAIPGLAKASNDLSIILQTTVDESGNARRADLLSQGVDIAMILQDAQDAISKAARSLQDALIDQLTTVDVIRSMASQDAANVKITGGSMDNVTIGATTAKPGTFTQLSIGGQTTGIADFRTTTGATVVAGRTSNTGAGSQPGAYAVYAPNASGTVLVWGQMRVSISNATAGSEASSWIFSTRVAGSFVDAATISSGGNLLVGTSTDGMTANGSLAIAQDLAHRGTKVGFFNTTPITKPTASGSWAGNAAGQSLAAALASLGLITNSTTA